MIRNYFLKRKIRKLLSKPLHWSEMKRLGSKEFVEPLNALLKDIDVHIRQRAAEVLGEIHEIQDINPLKYALLNDENNKVKDTAAETLGKIGDKRAIDALVKCLRKDWYQVALALHKLGWIPESGEQWINYSFALTSKDDSIALLESNEAIDFLSKVKTQESLDRMISIFKRISGASVDSYKKSEDRKVFASMKDRIENYLIVLGSSPSFYIVIVNEWLNLERPVERYLTFSDDRINNEHFSGLLRIIKKIIKDNSSLIESIDNKSLIAMINNIILIACEYKESIIDDLLPILVSKCNASQCLSLFEKYLNDPNEKAQKIAIKYLNKKDAKIAELLNEKYFQTNITDINKLIIEVLGDIGDESILDFLIAQMPLSDMKPEVISALGKIGGTRAISIIAEVEEEQQNAIEEIKQRESSQEQILKITKEEVHKTLKEFVARAKIAPRLERDIREGNIPFQIIQDKSAIPKMSEQLKSFGKKLLDEMNSLAIINKKEFFDNGAGGTNVFGVHGDPFSPEHYWDVRQGWMVGTAKAVSEMILDYFCDAEFAGKFSSPRIEKLDRHSLRAIFFWGRSFDGWKVARTAADEYFTISAV